jgi:hypothetical protein
VEGFKECFQSEARAMAQLSHPNLLGVHDFGEVAGMLYLVMEFIDGASLFQAEDGEAVEALHAVRIVRGVAAGLGHAHRHGILHRDIKPANILLTRGLEPKLGDFGLAVPAGEVVSGLAMGTPDYMAPEVVRDFQAASPASDVYSLGLILHELLTGVGPTAGQRPKLEIVPRLRGLCVLVQRATAPEPFMRYGDGEEMAKALAKWLAEAERVPPHLMTPAAGEPSATARVHADTEPVGDPSAGRSRAPALVVLALIAIVGGLAFAFTRREEPAQSGQAIEPPLHAGPRAQAFDLEGHRRAMREELAAARDHHVDAHRANFRELRSRAPQGGAWDAYFVLADEERGELPRFLTEQDEVPVDESMADLLNEFALARQDQLDGEHQRVVRKLHQESIAALDEADALPGQSVASAWEEWLEWLGGSVPEILAVELAGMWEPRSGGGGGSNPAMLIGHDHLVSIHEGDLVSDGSLSGSTDGLLTVVRNDDQRSWTLRWRESGLESIDEAGEVLARFVRKPFTFEAVPEAAPEPVEQPPEQPLADEDDGDGKRGRFAETKERFEEAIDGIQSEFESGKTKLDDLYLKHLEDLKLRYQDDGDFDNAVCVAGEISRFGDSGTIGSEDLVTAPKDLRRAQETYRTSLGKLAAKLESGREAVLRKYVEQLKPLKTALTRAGRLEEAQEADAEIARVTLELEGPPPPAEDEPDDGEAEVAAKEAEIPADAIAWQGHRYKVFREPRIAFDDAAKACRRLGGHLIFLESLKEQHFLAGIASPGTFWVGGTDEKNENRWRWLDGSRADIDDLDHELDDQNTRERDFLYLTGGGTLACRDNSGYQEDRGIRWINGYVCEWE